MVCLHMRRCWVDVWQIWDLAFNSAHHMTSILTCALASLLVLQHNDDNKNNSNNNNNKCKNNNSSNNNVNKWY